MMDKEFKVQGKKVKFVNKHIITGLGFHHISKLYIDDELVGEGEIGYINKALEKYEFQNSMKSAVLQRRKNRRDSMFEEFKKIDNFKRISYGVLSDFNSFVEEDKEYNMLGELYKAL